MCHPSPLKHGKIYVTIKIRYLEYTYKSNLYLITKQSGRPYVILCSHKRGKHCFLN